MSRISIMMAAAVGAVLPVAATATSTLYTDRAAFDAAVTVQTTYGFPEFTDFGGGHSLGVSTYLSQGVQFTAVSDSLYGYNDFYGAPYLGTLAGGPLTISTSASALGIYIGDYGAGGFTYQFGSQTGSVVIPTGSKTAFVGLTSDGGPISITFFRDSELDVPYFVVGSIAAAVPESATWTMMILGMGAVGFALRRQRKVTTRVFFEGTK